MISKKQIWTGIAAAAVMLVLIFDAKTALSGAQTGIDLCIRAVIPSLLPFIVLSIMINSNLTGCRLTFLQPIGNICGVPRGAEALLLLGILGGYPVGAQGVFEAYKNKHISKHDAKRLLGFCSNAGPAFIFGMMGGLFAKQTTTWVLWGIHIVSAIIVGCILPQKSSEHCRMPNQQALTVTQALEKGTKTMAIICAWIIMFRILIAFFRRWFLWFLPEHLQIWLIALTELSNGCFELYSITSQGLRFIMCAGALAFGGMCVYMQTLSVTGNLYCGLYFPGKVLQTCISIMAAIIVQPLIFSKSEQHPVSAQLCIAVAIITITTTAILYRRKKL